MSCGSGGVRVVAQEATKPPPHRFKEAMKTIRITAPLVQHGHVQFLKGRVRPLPDELADALIARGDAELVPTAEHATMVRRSETAVVPRPAAKPKAKPKGR